jgi:hypothetical protein
MGKPRPTLRKANDSPGEWGKIVAEFAKSAQSTAT